MPRTGNLALLKGSAAPRTEEVAPAKRIVPPPRFSVSGTASWQQSKAPKAGDPEQVQCAGGHAVTHTDDLSSDPAGGIGAKECRHPGHILRPANSVAIAAPMPREEPVTRATLSFRSHSITTSVFVKVNHFSFSAMSFWTSAESR